MISFFWRTCQLNILLSNDDGIYAVGLRSLYAAFTEAGHNVYVVAPLTEQSAVSNAITVFKALRAKEICESNFIGMGVHGTPADCVKLALKNLCPKKPDIVISGINSGPNAGMDIKYSGTVAAASEAAFAGYRAMALSFDNYQPVNLLEQAKHAEMLATTLPWDKIPARCVINVNYPDMPIDQTLGIRFCYQSSALWDDHYEERQDPRGNSYWWLHGLLRRKDVEEGSDRDLLTKGYITITPIRFDYTHRECMTELEKIFPA